MDIIDYIRTSKKNVIDDCRASPKSSQVGQRCHRRRASVKRNPLHAEKIVVIAGYNFGAGYHRGHVYRTSRSYDLTCGRVTFDVARCRRAKTFDGASAVDDNTGATVCDALV